MDSHLPEMALAISAMVIAIAFVVLHILLHTGVAIWWMLAVSACLLALSDLVMRSKR